MVDVILPSLASKAPVKVLFIGCRIYTKPYESYFPDSEYWTLEIDPKQARWGAKLHKIGDVRLVDSIFGHGIFDQVIFNGVLGFGVNTDGEQNQTFEALRRIMRPDGILVLGWNQGHCTDPLKLMSDRRMFQHATILDMPARKHFPGSSHIYDIFRVQ
jgi:hypothetical protein